MVVTRFPPVTEANPDGLLAVGGDLEVESLIMAYRSGIFPWPYNEHLLTWYAPPKRAVLFVDEFRISKRLARTLRKSGFSHRQNTNFGAVIAKCAELRNRGVQTGTWITDEMAAAYCRLHHRGFCSSYETYLNDDLVGGVYGVRIGRFFAAESSFYRVNDASKAAMSFLVQQLRLEGITWFDCQVLTPFSESFGAREISRDDFMELLDTSLDVSSS